MRKLLFVGAAAITTFVGGPAIAADMPVKVAAPAVVRPACAQFGGGYVGAHAGWTFYNNNWTDKDNYGFNFTGSDHIGDGELTGNNFAVGGQLGYNWQRGCTLWGFQADGTWTNTRASAEFRDFPGLQSGLGATSAVDWYATFRMRAGLVIDNLLLYATGGLAVADFERNFLYTNVGGTRSGFSSSSTRVGFVGGVGAEWAFGNNWSIGGEALYMGFPKQDTSFACRTAATCPGGLAFVGTPFRYDFADTLWSARVNLNYRWGGQ